jgi:AmmeMemoRadiSam system protein A
VGRIANAAAARQIASTLLPLLRPGDVVLVSSDFTHYGPRFGYTPFREQIPQRLDAAMDRAFDLMRRRDLGGFVDHLAITGDTICGASPIKVLLALLPANAVAEEIARATSGRMTGDFSHSVSYLSVGWRRAGGWSSSTEHHGFRQGQQVLDHNEQRHALLMARKTLESYLASGEVPSDDHLGVPAAGPFRDILSAFVTLKKQEHLRGCIGHIVPTQPLWQDIRDNAISAAVRDHRFPAVTAAELDELTVEISVLSSLRDISGPENFDVGRHGIILSARGRRAVFLPQVALEKGWDRDTTLTHLARKAGLSHDAWRSKAASFQVFEAQVFAEPE